MSGILSTALSGLHAASTRIAASAQNIANVSTAGSLEEGGKEPYTPVDVVQTTTPTGGVQAEFTDRDPATYEAFDPSASYANAEGLVAAPNISLEEEIVHINIAKHAYEANLAVIKTAKELDDALFESFDEKV